MSRLGFKVNARISLDTSKLNPWDHVDTLQESTIGEFMVKVR